MHTLQQKHDNNSFVIKLNKK